MLRKLIAFAVLALAANLAQALTVQTIDGKEVEVSAKTILDNVSNAAKVEGLITFYSTKTLPNAHVVVYNPRYSQNGSDYFLVADYSSSAGACKLLGFSDSVWWRSEFAKDYTFESLDLEGAKPRVDLLQDTTVKSVHANSRGKTVITSLECIP